MKPEDVAVETASVEEDPAASIEEPATDDTGAVGSAVDNATNTLGEEEGNSDQPPANDDPSADPDLEHQKERPASPQMKAPHISTLYDKQVRFGQAN